MTLRDTLLRLAAQGLFAPRWSDQILDEMIRNIVTKQSISLERARRLGAIMNAAFPDARIDHYVDHEVDLCCATEDRHVVAAAMEGQASTILTFNLRDFSPLPPGLHALSPDRFLYDLWSSHPDVIERVIVRQAADMLRPPVSLEQLLSRLSKVTPTFVEAIAPRILGVLRARGSRRPKRRVSSEVTG